MKPGGKGSIYLRVLLHILYIALCSTLDVPYSALELLYIAVGVQCSSGGWPLHLTGYAWPRNPAFLHMSFVDGGLGV